jgi:hypothetical protein
LLLFFFWNFFPPNLLDRKIENTKVGAPRGEGGNHPQEEFSQIWLQVREESRKFLTILLYFGNLLEPMNYPNMAIFILFLNNILEIWQL